jgi:hypothetical protein
MCIYIYIKPKMGQRKMEEDKGKDGRNF